MQSITKGNNDDNVYKVNSFFIYQYLLFKFPLGIRNSVERPFRRPYFRNKISAKLAAASLDCGF